MTFRLSGDENGVLIFVVPIPSIDMRENPTAKIENVPMLVVNVTTATARGSNPTREDIDRAPGLFCAFIQRLTDDPKMNDVAAACARDTLNTPTDAAQTPLAEAVARFLKQELNKNPFQPMKFRRVLFGILPHKRRITQDFIEDMERQLAQAAQVKLH